MAAGGDPNNISLGPGRLYVAIIGTAEPVSASAALPGAWRPIGYTEEGSTISMEVTNEEVEVAEELEPVRYVMVKRTTKASLEMAETTRRNLALALGAGPAAVNTAEAFEPPVPGADVGFMMVWDSDEVPTTATNIRWIFRKCRISGSIELSRKKAPDKALLPVSVDVEKPAGLAPFKVFPNATGNI